MVFSALLLLVFMGSPVFVKKGVAVRKGSSREPFVVVRSIIEPSWAGPSLRTIFMDKNIVGYCGYIGLISFVAYQPATGSISGILRGSAPDSLHRDKRLGGHAARGCAWFDDRRMTRRRRTNEI
jgi:hypothetical protein